MATTIRHKRSAVAGKQPLVSQLESGELAINTADGKVYLLRDDNTVQDITKRIFEGNSEVKVDDLGDSTVAQISATVNGNEALTITNAGFNFKNNIDIENAGTLTFRELTASGEDGVTLQPPSTLDAGYTLTLPPNKGSVGQILAVNASGELFFNDADIFGGNVLYVSQEQGDDENDGQSAPVKTVKRACQIASGLVYNSDGSINFRRINIKVAVGDYTEQNPIIVPDNTVIKGDGLRGCIIRPANANLDILRVRNACYFGEFTFRDGVDDNFVPLITGDYCVAFDDPDAVDVTDRNTYPNLPNTKPTITTSPYIQNCSILSFLGLNGAKIDGSKVESPNVPVNQIEAENPVVGAIPEQGKSMVANAFTMLSFGGTGWRLTNDAYAQIVSCFQIFLLNGVYTQSGGYCSITNSATNFGLYALRSSGYSPKAFSFDRSFVTQTGSSEGKQTVSVVGINRDAPVEEFILRFRDPDYKTAHDLLLSNKLSIAEDTVTWINAQIAASSPSIWAGFTYNEDKCRRDTRLLVDSIRYDIIFNSNYRTISSALRYFSGSFTNFADQKDQHIAAFAQAKAYTANILNDATATSRSNALWDEIIDILTNGDANTVPGDAVADAYSFPDPTNYNTSYLVGYGDARDQLQANKQFIIDEITAWIAVQVAAETPPFAGSFTYDAAKCERDVGLIIDALIYDITYGGNLQTKRAAEAYFVGTTAQYGANQKEETIAAYERLRDVIADVILEVAVTKSTGNAQTQDTSNTAGSAASKTFAVARIQEIIDFIDGGGVNEVTTIEPGTDWVSGNNEFEAYNRLNNEGAVNIAQNTTEWINEQIQANIWYGFTYDQSKCQRDTQLIVEAVAKDTWDTGNRYSRSAGLSYYTQNLQDSTRISISGQELQTIAAIDQAAVYANTYITSTSIAVQDFVNTRFGIVTTVINDPNDLPQPTEVSSEGDITNSYKTTPTETTFNAATNVNADTNIFTITSHGFTNGQKLIYDSDGNTPIVGLDNEQTYYVKILDANEFTLTFDESGDFDVDIRAVGANTHKFFSNVIEFFVEEVLSSHQTYQTLILESGAESYNFVPGRQISGTTGANNNSALVYEWEPRDRRLVVSVEEVSVGASTLRVQFDETSIISSDHSPSPNNTISINEVAAKTGLGTATFSITATDGSASLTNLVNLPEKQCWFHRPSIVNSSSHTWEYAGSGTDYNALPQNGGNTKEEFEQFEELPGRVYSSGTNELGDFKVGDFITAFNRTGNITFRNKVQVDELDALRLSLSDVAIEEISTSVNLGDDELGGPSDSRMVTQLAVRSFISNRLGGFVDKSVSTAAVPGAIVQLNTNGQLNPDLIPATRQFTNTNSNGYLSRLLLINTIPATDLKAGDIGTENYEQVELILSGNITAADGATITQPGVDGAIGYAKGSYSASGNILVATIGEAWDANEDSTGDPWEVSAGNLFVNGVDSGVNISSKGVSSEIIDNFFLRSSNSSQYLVLDVDDTYNFTTGVTISNLARTSNVVTVTTSTAHGFKIGNVARVYTSDDETFIQNGEVLTVPTSTSFTIANTGIDVSSFAVTDGKVYTIVTSADGNAQGAVTESRFGVLTNIDNTSITAGSGYLPSGGTLVYKDVPLTANTGVGTGATADITVTAGAVTDVDIATGGSGYAVGDLLSANNSNLGGAGSSFECEVVSVEKRAYVDILGGELFVASASSIDFVEDNDSVDTKKTINLDDTRGFNFLAGTTGGGGAVDYIDYRINIPNHGFTSGDPLKYDTLGNVAIGGLLNGNVYYAKSIDANNIELYEGFSLLNKVEFTSTPANNNHNLTRYVVNVVDNSILVEGHGLTTGDAIRIESLDDGSSANVLPDITGDAITSGSRFFVGSVTTNSFTLHELRSDALSSINDLVTNAKDIDDVGVGSADIIANNVSVQAVVNTSSKTKDNWSTLAVTNIDAENIISGTISPSRLGASGTPNSDTALFGDSGYKVVVQTLKKATTTDNPITLTGSSIGAEFYGDPVNIGIANVDFDALATFSKLGTARFLQTQFDVASDGSGQVFIKDGVVDAGTLDGLDSSYFLNPANLTSLVPVTRGGTAIGTYAIGDILYAQSSGSLNTLNIGRANNFLKSNGTTPEWGTALDLSEGLDVGSAKLSSTSTGTGSLYNENVTSLDIGGAATNIKIGSVDVTRNLLPFIDGYEATISQSVVVNLGSLTANTNDPVANGETEVPMADTSSILVGMLVTGSGSIPANTTVSGVTDDYIYLSANTTGTIFSGTTLTFTYTPFTIGVRDGDTINLNGTTVTNLDGSWPVIGATSIATSFTIRTTSNVTADPNDVVQGTATIDANMVIKTPKVIIGAAEASTSPTNASLEGSDGIGTDVAGGSMTIEAGIGTGNSTGADIIFKTGEVSTTSNNPQTSTERLRIDTSGKATFTGEVEVNNTISTTETTVALLDDTATTINMGGAATTVEIGAATGTTTIHNNVDIDLDLNVDGSDITTNQTGTFNLINTNATTLNIGGAATTINMGTGGDGGGTTTIGHDLVVTGDLTVNGNTTTINSTTLTVDDLNIVIASGAASAAAANGAGLTIDGANVTFTYDSGQDRMDLNEDLNLESGNAFFINDQSVLNATTLGAAVVNSSLQTLGTISTGIWQGTIISPTYGGTGINNGTKTITLGGNLTTSGAFNSTFTMTGATSVTFPTSGTLAITGNPLSQFASTTSAQLRGVLSDETGTGVAVFGTSPTFTTGINAASTTMALFDTTATTLNLARAATSITIGATTGTTNIRHNLNVTGDLDIDGGDLTFSDASINIANTTPTTITMGNAATTFTLGATTGTLTVRNATTTLNGNLNVNGNTIDTDETGTFNLVKDNVTTLAFAQAATEIVVGETKAAADLAGALGEMVVRLDLRTNNDMYIDGDLFVSQINNTPIGNVTPSTGAFTTLAANNFVTFTDATNATGATFATGTAAVKITGGLYVAKDIRADNFIGDMDASYLTSGIIPDARIQSSGVTQHQLDITGTGALNAGSITSGFGNINIGTSIFSGNGSGLTTLNASNLSSGTVADARIQSSSITQHQGDITGTGALNSGSITNGFGSIDIGTDIFTGNGSGLTTLNASNLSSGTVSGSRLGGNQSMAGVKTFSDTTASTSTTTGAVKIAGGLGVAGDLYAGTLNGNGAGLTSLNASNLGSGTVPNARISGTYSNITGTGALNAGEITSGFGNINIGTSTFTGNGSGLTSVNAATLDGIDSLSFLRSDQADTMTGLLTLNHAGNEMLRMQDTAADGSPYITWYQAGTRRGYIQYVDGGDRMYIANEGGSTAIDLDGGVNGLIFRNGANAYTVWHSGNDGAGSGLSADNLDGISSGSFLRSDADDSFSGTLSGAGAINITGNVTANAFSGDGSGLTGISADDANTLDGIDSSQFLRSDQNDTMDAGVNTTLTILSDDTGASTIQLYGNSQGTGRVYVGQSSAYGGGIEYNGDNSPATTGAGSDYITLWRRDNGTDSWTGRNQYNSNNWEFRGEVTAYASDARLKDVTGNIDNAIEKVKALNGVIYTWNDTAYEKGLKTYADDKAPEAGLLAQEVQKVLPEVVVPAPFDKEYLTIKYERVVPLLVEAIKEQQAQIDAQATEIAELREMVQKLLDK
jgi:hypothetical protein